MPWVQLDDRIASHPKIVRAGPEAAWMWAAAIAYCNLHLTDGFVPARALTTLGPYARPRQVADRLVEARKPGGQHGLFERRGDDYAVHDYLQHNPTAEEVLRRRAEAAAKKAKQRGGHHGLSPGDNPGDNEGDTRGTDRGSPEGTSSGHERDSRAHGTTPTPTPTPDQNSKRSEGHAPAVSRARAETGLISLENGPTRGASLMPPLPKNTLWPGRPPVPDFVHAELRQRLGPAQTEQDLVAFYERTAAAWADQPIAEDAPKFWRQRFAEWQGGGSSATTKRQAIRAQNDAALRAVLSRGKAGA